MWPLLSGGQPQTVAMHDAPVKEVVWIPQMNLLVSGSWDKTLRCACTVHCSQSSSSSLGSWIHIVNWCSLRLLRMAAYYYSMFFKRISMLPMFVNVFLTVENQYWLHQVLQKIYVFHPVYLSILVFMPSVNSWFPTIMIIFYDPITCYANSCIGTYDHFLVIDVVANVNMKST